MKIVVQNKLKKRYLPIKDIKALFMEAINAAMENEQVQFPVLISILLVENDEIQRINLQYREKDSVTDVLSFPMLDMEDGVFISEPGEMDMDQGRLFLEISLYLFQRQLSRQKPMVIRLKENLRF